MHQLYYRPQGNDYWMLDRDHHLAIKSNFVVEGSYIPKTRRFHAKDGSIWLILPDNSARKEQ